MARGQRRKKYYRPRGPSPELLRFKKLALLATFLALIVVTLGAYTRLSDAGLGCPDWPGCYGLLTVPDTSAEVDAARQAFPERQFETDKAWKEMIHRYVAGTLGLLVLALAVLAWRNRKEKKQPVSLPLLLVPLIVFQALLGMWTVTELLNPAIVLAHLLGGMTTLGILWWLALTPAQEKPEIDDAWLARAALFALIVVSTQIALGGWTSANYAAMACPDFPTCQNAWLPEADYAAGFDMIHSIDDHDARDFEGGVLSHPARVAIHMAHRFGALAVVLFHLFLGSLLYMRSTSRAVAHSGLALIALTLLQVAIGVGIVRFGLPLPLATTHNVLAALLLLMLITINRLVRLGNR